MYEDFPYENYYAFVCYDSENSSDLRPKVRDQHVARLNKLENQKRLLMAGPLLDPNQLGIPKGGIIIAKFDSFDEAKQWLSEEPYLKNGAYRDVQIFSYKDIFPKN